MIYTAQYLSPVGKMTFAGNETSLIGLWMEGQKYFLGKVREPMQEKEDLEIFSKTRNWLDRYFNKERPLISELRLEPEGSVFQKAVWNLLCEIPYGAVTTYGDLAGKTAERLGKERMSAQAVGGAVGRNPISVIIPCHRVVGSNGSLTGYAGGIDKKIALLRHEGTDISRFFVPQ